MLPERIKHALFFFFFSFLGFTTTRHVNEPGAFSALPRAWIVLEKLHLKKDIGIIFLQANSKQFSSSSIVTVDQREKQFHSGLCATGLSLWITL